MDTREIQDFLDWYWKEIDGKPSSDSSLTIAEYYIEDKRKERNMKLYGMEEITKVVKCPNCGNPANVEYSPYCCNLCWLDGQ